MKSKSCKFKRGDPKRGNYFKKSKRKQTRDYRNQLKNNQNNVNYIRPKQSENLKTQTFEGKNIKDFLLISLMLIVIMAEAGMLLTSNKYSK